MDITLLEQDLQRQIDVFKQHRSEILAIDRRIGAFLDEGQIVMTGIATSLYALEGAHFLLSSQKFGAAELINTCDLLDYSYCQTKDKRPLLILSRSGESAETIRLLETISRERVVIGISEGLKSPLADRADLFLKFSAAERAFPNTVSFTLSQIYALAVIQHMLERPNQELAALLTELDDLSEVVLNSNGYEEIGKTVAGAKLVILEGQGHLTGVVQQYALDFHETKTACVPILGGILRHGPVELTELEGAILFMLIPNNGTALRKIKLAQELSAAGKRVALLTNSTLPVDEKITIMRLPECTAELEGIVFTLAMQKVYEAYVKHKGLKTLVPSLVGKVTRKE